MSAQQSVCHSITLRPLGNITQKRFVGWNSQQAGAGANSMGVADENGVSGGAVIRVIALGSAIVASGAAIDGTVTALESDAEGRAIPRTTGAIVARLMPGQTAAAANVPIEVFVIPN